MVVYLVHADRWEEVGRFQLRVLTRGGYERVEVKPAVELNNKGQVGLGRVPVDPTATRDTFQDFGLSMGLTTTAVRSGWTTTLTGNVVGASNQLEALRYGERQDAAPQVDLASYLVSTGNSRVALSLGHISFGSHRHLFNGFSSRGAAASVRLGTRADVALAVVNGSAIVGWSNPVGLSDGDHRTIGLTAGVELTPRRGALRVEASALTARLLPRAGFNQGGIVDAERNQGGGLRVTASDGRQRLRIDGGLAWARFGNPADPLLSGGVPVVAVAEASRSARYLDLAFTPVQGPRGSLTTGFRHELVEPLFGSLQSFVRPDVFQNVLDASGTIGTVAIQGSATWLHDNLDDIPSVLKTFTRAQQLNVAVPLASVVAAAGAAGMPTITYAINRVRQVGAGLPLNSEFQDSHVPDQVSTDQAMGVEWQLARWRTGYRFNRSFQDNRQIGRALSDLANLAHNVTFGVSAGARADVGIELAYEGAENREVSRTDATRRVALNANLRPSPLTTMTALVSRTTLRNDVDAGENRSTDISLQLTQSVPIANLGGRQAAQLFIRYARMNLWTLTPGTAQAELRRLWTVNSGVTIGLF
jgi:hypothetical protein